MRTKRDIQNLLNEVNMQRAKGDSKGFEKACQMLGREIYIRSLRGRRYRVELDNPAMENKQEDA